MSSVTSFSLEPSRRAAERYASAEYLRILVNSLGLSGKYSTGPKVNIFGYLSNPHGWGSSVAKFYAVIPNEILSHIGDQDLGWESPSAIAAREALRPIVAEMCGEIRAHVTGAETFRFARADSGGAIDPQSGCGLNVNSRRDGLEVVVGIDIPGDRDDVFDLRDFEETVEEAPL